MLSGPLRPFRRNIKRTTTSSTNANRLCRQTLQLTYYFVLHTYLVASSQGFRVGGPAGNGVCRGVSSRHQCPGRLQRLHLRLRPGRPGRRSNKPHTHDTHCPSWFPAPSPPIPPSPLGEDLMYISSRETLALSQ